jgi:hypothetical protein
VLAQHVCLHLNGRNWAINLRLRHNLSTVSGIYRLEVNFDRTEPVTDTPKSGLRDAFTT